MSSALSIPKFLKHYNPSQLTTSRLEQFVKQAPQNNRFKRLSVNDFKLVKVTRQKAIDYLSDIQYYNQFAAGGLCKQYNSFNVQPFPHLMVIFGNTRAWIPNQGFGEVPNPSKSHMYVYVNEEHKIIGAMIFYRKKGNQMYIDELCSRGKGLGSRLLQHVINETWNKTRTNYIRLFDGTKKGNTSFYAKFGFKRNNSSVWPFSFNPVSNQQYFRKLVRPSWCPPPPRKHLPKNKTPKPRKYPKPRKSTPSALNKQRKLSRQSKHNSRRRINTFVI